MKRFFTLSSKIFPPEGNRSPPRMPFIAHPCRVAHAFAKIRFVEAI
jgi:hypothetical protein